MPKSRAAGGRTQSIANPKVFTSPADAPKKDTRGGTNEAGRQGRAVCAECGWEGTLRKVSRNNPSRYDDLPTGALVIVNHRPGGGVYSRQRNDVLCKGSSDTPSKVVE